MPPCNFSSINKTVRRAIAPYFGGKWRIAPWVIKHFPDHVTYLECFGGAASCLMRKPRAAGEIYNDLNDEVVNLFRVLRDPELSQRFLERLYLTPYARQEYLDSYVAHHDNIEQARRTLFRLQSAFGGDCQVNGRMTGFKTAKGDKDAPSFARLPEQLLPVIDRLRGVLIEKRPALDVIRQYDSPTTLIYADPPYVPQTRTSTRVYKHEMTVEEHRDLAAALNNAQGMVVLSGYPSPLYDELYAGWECHTRQAFTLARSERTEALWLSPAASAALKRKESAVVSNAGDDRATDPLVGRSPAVAALDDFDDFGTVSAG